MNKKTFSEKTTQGKTSTPVAAALIDEYMRQAEEEPYDRLTAREREILKLIADGHTN